MLGLVEMAMRWAVLRHPLRRNGVWRCGVDVVATCLVAQAAPKRASSCVTLSLALGGGASLGCHPCFRREAQATRSVLLLGVASSAMRGVVAILMVLATPVGAEEPRVDLQPLGIAACVLFG